MYFSRCSSVPNSSSVGTSMAGPCDMARKGTDDFENSSRMIRSSSGSLPRSLPPYFFGMSR